MEFDDTHKVRVESLTREEALQFTYWLQDELTRHETCILEAQNQKAMRPVIWLILESAEIRHRGDISEIREKIGQVMERFGL